MAELHHFFERAQTADVELWEAMRRSTVVLRDALRLYPAHQLALSFNGGKDATVVLHLLRLSMYLDLVERISPEEAQVELPRQLAEVNVSYFVLEDSFEEIEDFVDCTVKKYELNMRKCSAERGLVDGVRTFLGEAKGVNAFCMGVRQTDPSGARLNPFSPSTEPFPPFMRVCPILHWTYDFVWRFLRGAELQYCVLYDRGFTSLGVKSKSVPNPALLRPDGTYDPAFLLENASWERVGRRTAKEAEAEACTSRKSVAVCIVDCSALSGAGAAPDVAALCAECRRHCLKVPQVQIISPQVPLVHVVGHLASHHHGVLVLAEDSESIERLSLRMAKLRPQRSAESPSLLHILSNVFCLQGGGAPSRAIAEISACLFHRPIKPKPGKQRVRSLSLEATNSSKLI